MPEKDKFRESMELIEKSGVLNPDTNMKQLMDIAKELDELEAVDGLKRPQTDTLIYRHFIYKRETKLEDLEILDEFEE